jgi:hypothetical protein
VSAEDLALRALGEELADLPESHLVDCAHCQSELDQLRAVVTTARSVQQEDYPVTPPASVWEAVVAELGLAPTDTDGASDPESVPLGSDLSGSDPSGSDPSGSDRGPSSDAPVVPLPAQRRSRRQSVLLAAAAGVVGLLIGVGVTAVATSGNDDLPVVASTRLTVLADDSRGGDAEVLSDGGGRVLELDVPTLTPDSKGFYEVWLLDKDAKRLVSIGLLDLSQGTTARFPIPDDLDLATYPVVDVSVEPADGNPAHSGDSIVRGTLAG